MTTRQAPPVQQPTRRPGTTRGAFTLLCAGMVMSNLDLTVANIGLPAMQHDLAGSTLGQLSWVLDGYAIVFAALLVPAGRWADRVGLRRAFLIGAALFAGASAACALAPDVWLLVGGRLLQAAGAAVMLPASLALLLATSPADRRPSVVRMWAAVSTTAAALGPVLGGLLVTASWRWLFLVNLPVGVVTVALGGRLLPAHRPERKTSVPDVAGSLMAALGIGALALTLVKGADWGWSSWRTLAAAACGALLLTVTAWRIARHPRPLIEPALLRIRTFTASGAAALLYGATFGAFLLSFTLWCQSQLGWSAIRTGLALTPGTACTPFVTLASAALARRYRPTAVITVGSLALAAGVLWWTLADLSLTPYPAGLLPGVLLACNGCVLTLTGLVDCCTAELPSQSFATGSAVNTMMRQVGVVLGVAAVVAMLGHRTSGADMSIGFREAWCGIAATALLTIPVALLPTVRRRIGRSATTPPSASTS